MSEKKQNEVVETTEVVETEVVEPTGFKGFWQKHKKGLMIGGGILLGLAALKLCKGRSNKSEEDDLNDDDFVDADYDEMTE